MDGSTFFRLVVLLLPSEPEADFNSCALHGLGEKEMKNFSVNATALDITFTCDITHEEVILYIGEMPEPNWLADSIRDSENSLDEEFDADNGRSYRVIVYKNQTEGNVEVFDITEEEFEINEFEINEYYVTGETIENE